MYKAVRQSRVCESMQLIKDDNTIADTITTDIVVEDAYTGINKAKNDIIRAQLLLKTDTTNKAKELLGEAIINLFTAIFGDVQTKKICDFYENRETEMLTQIWPFISEVIFPQMEKAIKLKKETIAENFKLSRSQRNRLGI